MLVAAATTLFILGMLSRNDFNTSWFITAGDRFCDPHAGPNLLVRKNSDGFDGQFYYRLALDPFIKLPFNAEHSRK